MDIRPATVFGLNQAIDQERLATLQPEQDADDERMQRVGILKAQLLDTRASLAKLTRQYTEAQNEIAGLHDTMRRLERQPPSADRDEQIEVLRQQLADLQKQAEALRNRMDLLQLQYRRLIAELQQLQIRYDATAGLFITLADDEAVNPLDLAWRFWDEAKHDAKRSRAGRAVADLLDLLAETASPDPARRRLAPAADSPDDPRVRAWIKTRYAVGGQGHQPVRVFEAYAPVLARESEVGANDLLGVACVPGVRGGVNAREALDSQARAQAAAPVAPCTAAHVQPH